MQVVSHVKGFIRVSTEV